ncbi:hypothetical protein D5085_16400 [Ectothiorhodospiraceae bacterium BW-2]|nr:hypothetical protein D5085_16400 [Ectothiorhodospiraceae bacterium BW-2]
MTEEQLFADLAQLSATFAAELQRVAEQQSLGATILVLANAIQQPALWRSLSPSLVPLFERQADTLRQQLRRGLSLSESEDDVLVFLKLMAIGLTALQPAQTHQCGRWELQFNPLRALRPPRAAKERVVTNHKPFDAQGFHFNRPFLRAETLWQGELQGRAVDLLYNKFPFIDYHLLLVPERQREAAQYLTEADHNYLWGVMRWLGERITGIGGGYNSYGAFASVNHLHVQLFVRQAPLPVESRQWCHHGGSDPYPTEVMSFSGAEEGWRAIAHLHEQGVSYNLLYRPDRLYLFPRRYQGTRPLAKWSGGAAWYELCGGVVCFNRDDVQSLTPVMIAAELSAQKRN